MPYHRLHHYKKYKNWALFMLLVALVVSCFGLTIVKVKQTSSLRLPDPVSHSEKDQVQQLIDENKVATEAGGFTQENPGVTPAE